MAEAQLPTTNDSGSFISVEPSHGALPNSTVTVSWKIAGDIGYTATASDELRLITSAGVLVSRVFIDTIDSESCPSPQVVDFSRGSLTLRCPPFPGAYVAAFYSSATGKRVLSTPFRVFGEAFAPPQCIKLTPTHVSPFDVVSATFLWGTVLSVIRTHLSPKTVRAVAVTLTEYDAPHNDGYTGHSNGFTLASRAVIVPVGPDDSTCTVRLFAPTKNSMYSVRILASPLSELPIAIGTSTPLIVAAPDSPLPPVTTRASFAFSPRNLPSSDEKPLLPDGTNIVVPSTRQCWVGETLTVRYELFGSRDAVKPPLLTPLDHCRIYAIGRSEADRFDGRLERCVGTVAPCGTVSLTAPGQEGCFDVAFRRFLDNDTLCLARETLITKLPNGEIEVLPNADPSRNCVRRVVVRCEVPHFICVSDRIHAYEETANLIQCTMVRVLDPQTAEADLCIGAAGKCNLKYFSARVGDEMPWRASELLATSPSAVLPIPTASLFVLHTVPCGVPAINVLFENSETVEWRPEAIRRRDVLALFRGGVAESRSTVWADDPEAMPAEQVVFIRGREECEVQFIAGDLLPPGEYTVRYMVALPETKDSDRPGPRLVASSECTFFLVDPHSSEMLGRATRFAALARPGNDVNDLHEAQKVAASSALRSGAKSSFSRSSGLIGAQDTAGNAEQLGVDDDILGLVLYSSNRVTLEQASAAELAPVRHRHKRYTLRRREAAFANPQTGSTTKTWLSTPQSNQSNSLAVEGATASKVTRRGSAMNMTRLDLVRRLSTTKLGIPAVSLMGVRRSSTVYASLSRRNLKDYTPDKPINIKLDTELSGSIIAPRISSTDEIVVVTFHVVQGHPRTDDLILLLNDDCTRVMSELPVGLCHLQSESTNLGTALLNPPRFAGKYVAGYYSQKHAAVVMLSERHRVKQGERRSSPESSAGRGVTPAHLAITPKAAGSARVYINARVHPAVRAHGVPRPAGDLGRIRALIVGCSYTQDTLELAGPANDVAAMSHLLAAHGGVLPEHMVVLEEASLLGPNFVPTAANMRRCLRWLTHGCRNTDHLIFYFSGRGARLLPPRDMLDPAAVPDNYLLPSDYDFGDRAISYKEIAAALYDGHVPPGTAVTVFIDACFTGTALDAYDQIVATDSSASTTPLGVELLRTSRDHNGVAPTAKWRAAVPSQPRPLVSAVQGAEWDCSKPTTQQHGLSKILVPLHTLSLNSPPSSSFVAPHSLQRKQTSDMMPEPLAASAPEGRRRMVLFEATRERSDSHMGAWDVFVREEGCTMGLFTYALGQVLAHAAAEQGGPPHINQGLRWFEFEDRVKRIIRKESYGASQLPLCSYGHPSGPDEPVFPLGEAEDE